MFGARRPARARLTPTEAADRRARLVGLVEALPGARVTEHGRHLGLEVRGKRWGWVLEDHHEDGRLALNCKAPPGSARSLSARAPGMFHVPKYVGRHGWVGLWLDLPRPDWSEVEAALTAAYRMAAPKSLLARLGDAGTVRPGSR